MNYLNYPVYSIPFLETYNNSINNTSLPNIDNYNFIEQYKYNTYNSSNIITNNTPTRIISTIDTSTCSVVSTVGLKADTSTIRNCMCQYDCYYSGTIRFNNLLNRASIGFLVIPKVSIVNIILGTTNIQPNSISITNITTNSFTYNIYYRLSGSTQEMLNNTTNTWSSPTLVAGIMPLTFTYIANI